MGFLKFILTVLIIYVTIRLVWRFFGKAILAWMGKKAMQRVQRSFESRMGANGNPFGNTQQQQTQQSSKKSSQPLEKKTVGEYIDFEEID
ncbi:MAG: DUF4834 family protein [Nonlabens sp.]|nr:DUF4834 family protein [Nonlabens sp.]MDP5100783.1 DUF4834 family protein [Nonlabens sp.]